MIRFLILLLWGVAVVGVAQKSPIKYGEIPMEDMKMTVYPGDSSASAVMLTDYGEASVSISTTSSSMKFERHVRIKILKKNGLRWADASIPLFYSGFSEDKLNLKASTYNLEGDKIIETKVNKESIFKEKLNRSINLQKFTFPNVKEGSILEYSYSLISPSITSFPNWQFQYEIPVRHSEYWAVIPDIFVIEKYMQGYVQATSYETKETAQNLFTETAHHWIIDDVPAFKAEPFMTSETDYLTKINFALTKIQYPQYIDELITSWQRLNDGLLAHEFFGGVVRGSSFLKRISDDVVEGESDDMKKLLKIYNHVQKIIEWDGVKDFITDRPKEIFDKKKGSVGDINLTLASMLDKVGIPVDMVLLSTRDHGFIREQYPMIRQFNYVVCVAQVNGKSMFLDATEKYLPAGVLPERCLNGLGLMISKKSHGWVSLESKTKEREVISADFVMDPAAELTGKVSVARDGYAGAHFRKEFTSKGEKEYTKSAIGNKVNWEVAKTSFEDVEDHTKSAKEIHELTIADHAVVSGDVIYLNPFVMGQLEQNPFKSEQRVYPVDFGSLKEKLYMAKITLPDGYLVDEMPANKVITLPNGGGKFFYSCTQVGNVINLTSNLQINKGIFIQSEYPTLREFYNQVVAKQTEQIILKKK